MNKKIKDTVIAVSFIVIAVALILWVFYSANTKGSRELAKRISALSSRGGVPDTVEGLREAITIYEGQIEQHVKDGAQTGVYWKILAIRLADRGMHRDALTAIEKALEYNTVDPTLFYLTGEYASTVAASIVGFRENSSTEKERYTNLAETSYLRAIQLDPVYTRPLLGLGILYTFDLDRPAEAIPHLERYVLLTQGSVEGMFVLARAYFMTENYDNAIELYERIISKTKDAKVKEEAENNRETIRNLIYG